MEAASVAPEAPKKKSRAVVISPTWLGVCAVGAVVAIAALFLKAFNRPFGYTGTDSMWGSVSGGKVILACAIITLVVLFAAIRLQRRGILWVAYIAALIALLFAALDAGAGFTVTGSNLKLGSSYGPIICTVGCAVMFISLLIARFTEKRV